MSSDTQDLNVKVERTRRNIMRMGVVGASAVVANLATTNLGKAGPLGWGDRGGNCLLRGTAIRTASGSRKIEDLAIGDLLPTMFGGSRLIQWIGHYPIKKSNLSKPWPKDARPVVCPAKAGMFSRRKACRGKNQNPVVWIAGWRETKTLKPIDNVSRGEATSHRAVTTVNAKVASKMSSPEGRAPNRRAKAAWGAEI